MIDGTPDLASLLPPIGSQEIWAAGVTYYRSRTARMEEAKLAGGGDFYDRVYDAARPELFFKATPHRVRGHRQPVRIRKDSKWNVPEPELALVVSSRGEIVGYTIGNDMSSRDIEGENPLYLPQAKVYDGSCGLGPCVLISSAPLPPETEVRLAIRRGGRSAFEGSTTLSSMKREPKELVEYLVPRQQLSSWMRAAHRYRHRAARRFYARLGRRDRHHHRADRDVDEYRGVGPERQGRCSMDEQMQCVFVANGEIHAQQVRAFLEAAGISAIVHGEALRHTHGLTLDGLGTVEILVAPNDLEQARALLESAEAGDFRLTEDDEDGSRSRPS